MGWGDPYPLWPSTLFHQVSPTFVPDVTTTYGYNWPDCRRWVESEHTHHHCPPITWLPVAPDPQPWICPKCGNVYGPTVTECARCNREEEGE